MDGMELFKKLAQCEDKEQMQRVIEEHNASQKPQTNADRIRAMSDEELARWLVQSQIEQANETCKIFGTVFPATDEVFDKITQQELAWLQQLAKEVPDG